METTADVDKPEADHIKKVSVVLPAYNEATCIGKLLDRIHDSLEGSTLTYVVLVVDDGSDDNTVEIAEQRSVRMPIRILRHKRNSGYGAALQTGLLAAVSLSEVIVTMDADDSHDPALIHDMLAAIESGNDLVIASRMQQGGSVVGVPLRRRLLSEVASGLLRVVMPLRGVRDFTSGYRAYRASLLKSLAANEAGNPLVRETGFVAGLELLRKVRSVGASVAEVPLVLRYDRKLSPSRMDVFATSRDVFRILATPVAGVRGASRNRFTGSDRSVAIATAASDMMSTLAAFASGYIIYGWALRAGWVVQPRPAALNLMAIGGLFGLLSVIVLWRGGQYRGRAAVLDLSLLQSTARYLLLSASLFLSSLFLAGRTDAPAALIGLAMALAVPVVVLGRRVTWSVSRKWQLSHGRGRRVLIYGSGATGQLLMKKIMQSPRVGARVVGFVDSLKPLGSTIRFNASRDREPLEVPVMGRICDLEDLVEEHDIAELLVTVPLGRSGLLRDLLQQCGKLGIDVGFVPSVGDVRADQLQVENISAVTVLRHDPGSATRAYLVLKRLFDISLSLLLIIATLPIWLAVAVLIRLDSPGPVFFRQVRVGQHGRRFQILKFRTMAADVDPYGRSAPASNDPRVTGVGRFLRGTGVDELPQLLTVLLGHMSLVGPRPEMPFIVDEYDSTSLRRLEAKPGITGIWQLSPDRNQEIHDNIEYDLYYIRNRSMTLDALILGETLIFLVENLVRALPRRAGTTTADRATSMQQALNAAAVKKNGHRVFVAADQRGQSGDSLGWESFIWLSLELARQWPVTLLVAPKYSGRVDDVVETIRMAASPDRGAELSELEYLEYTSGSLVQEAASNASVVITDLLHVAGWALEGAADLVRVDQGNAYVERNQYGISDSAVGILKSLQMPVNQVS